MVLIGFDEHIPTEKAENLLTSHNIRFFPAPFQTGTYHFFEIYTPFMQDYGLCCLGRNNDFLDICVSLLDEPNNAFHLQTKRKFEEDVSFWKRLITDLVNQVGHIAVVRYYPEIPPKETVHEIHLSRLNSIYLLHMDMNEPLIVRP